MKVSEKKPPGYKYLDQGAIDQTPEGNVLLMGFADGTFTDVARETGVFDSGWAWNAKFADLDNDEWLDLYVANGWWLETRLYSNRFFHNNQGQDFSAAEEQFGLVNRLKESSYTYLDLDNDGDLDIITTAMHGFIHVYINNEYQNNLMIFEFRDHKGNFFGIGNKVYIYYGEHNERHQVREIKSGGGFLSFDAPYAHFGLGKYDQVHKIEIVWSTGEKTTIEHPLAANQKYIITRDK